jgi:hypothetical protein
MNTRALKTLMRSSRGLKRERRYKTVRHQLLHNPTVPGILEFLGVPAADRTTQESAVRRAAQVGTLFPRECAVMRSAGWPGT